MGRLRLILLLGNWAKEKSQVESSRTYVTWGVSFSSQKVNVNLVADGDGGCRLGRHLGGVGDETRAECSGDGTKGDGLG